MKNRYETRGEVTVIFFKRNDGTYLETLIDTEDLPKVQSLEHSWCAYFHKHTQSAYVRGYSPGKRVMLHRLIIDAPTDYVVDHINHDTLDNRKANLRVVDTATNSQNRRGAMERSKTGIRNVHWDKSKTKWRVELRANCRRIYVAYSDDIVKAEKLAIEAREKYL